MLPVSLDCPFLIVPSAFSKLTFIYPLSCVPLCTLLIALSVFSNVYLSCVLCTLCCHFLWIVHFSLPLRCSLTFICPVSCVPYVPIFSGLSIFDCPYGVASFSGLSLFLCPFGVASFSGLFLFLCPFGVL